MACFDIKP